MIPRRLHVMFAFFTYTGNSSGTAVNWDVASWWAKTLLKIKTQIDFTHRICYVTEWSKADTPITMTRNLAIKTAKQEGADVLVMVDSDIRPDMYLGQPGYGDVVPFFDTAFTALYDHYDKGPLVIAAPYGGQPPHENMFVFTWSSKMNAGDEAPFELRQYTREEAQQFMGLAEAAALPTGLIMYDLRAFDLIEKPWFHYEWSDDTDSAKASTEDVQNTRDISIACLNRYGYNPLRCAWSSWAGHYKSWCVGKPAKLHASNVADRLSSAIRRGWMHQEGIMDLDLNPLKATHDTLILDLPKQVSQDVKVCSQFPEGFPEKEITDLSPGAELFTRDIFGERTVSFVHMTSLVHLTGLRNVIREESEQKGHPLDIVEVGSWTGDSAITMSRYARRIRCVDNAVGSDEEWDENLAKMAASPEMIVALFRWNTRNHPEIELKLGASLEMAAKQDWQADVIHIDADHKYESARADIEAWWPHVKPGGLMIGHDFNTPAFPGVTQAVLEFFGNKTEGFAMIHNAGGYFRVRKNEQWTYDDLLEAKAAS